ncbi:MAG TPA: AraC family transcriptional regulator [Deltaproteobacteria bacterium]|jgi:AraC-like DNA-binding protein|nr:AraC family transcriptional regulator [Deltaproteobacteria bacterium]HOI06757.1 AraC family transcriptional regulator [Deltaproteobacteria bacterium]
MEKAVCIRSSPVLPVYRLLNTTLALIRIAGKFGIGADALLAGSGIRPADLEDPDKLILTVQELALIRRFIDLVDIPWIGLEVGKEYHFNFSGKLGAAIMLCDDWMEGLQMLHTYSALNGTYFQTEVRMQGGEGRARIREIVDLGGRRFHSEAELGSMHTMVMHTMVSLGYRTETVFKEVHFAFPEPDYAHRYGEYFSCPVKFGQPEAAIVFDARYMHHPLPFANPQAKAALVKECEALTRRLREHGTLTSRVRHELLLGYDTLPGLGELARRVNLSPRTVRRRLRDEGTSFMDILTGVRREKASDLLKETGLPLEDISERLGYGDMSSFYRAFRSWEGCTPGAFRERHKDLSPEV